MSTEHALDGVADTAYARGYVAGYAEGLVEGFAEGFEEAQKEEERICRGFNLLLGDSRLAEAKRYLHDPEVREQVFEEYGI